MKDKLNYCQKLIVCLILVGYIVSAIMLLFLFPKAINIEYQKNYFVGFFIIAVGFYISNLFKNSENASDIISVITYGIYSMWIFRYKYMLFLALAAFSTG